ncbi:winged helix-turn-helix transcriptional regulator [Rhizobium halophilum]|uniref:winged helix-turn-helix transcriptional regulator n=1 Tax=Rhizobium halophilum TaxID=2846852 RepID=UPI001EFD9F33|nr:helix-turn-helix domain-containing protein [Rhizobium halophilum]MCF6367444.1 helix-turn-helix transcriptional regulator [Rhizobium halophilum]
MDRCATQCGLDVSLAVVGGKWKPLILYHLQSGPTRFSEIKRRIGGISEKVLIQQLRELVAMEVLVRHDHQQVPPVVHYTLTAFGETLVQALVPLCEWGTYNRARVADMLQRPSQKERDRGHAPARVAASD